MTKVHRLIVLVVDHDDLGADEVARTIESQHYPNHCIYPRVLTSETREVEWHDGHALNRRATMASEVARLFSPTLSLTPCKWCSGTYTDFQGAPRKCLAGGEGCGLRDCVGAHGPQGGW